MRLNLNAVLAVMALGAVLTFALFGRSDEELSGRATIVDGDSLRIDGIDIRIKGIDAPEMNQSCTRQGRPYACGEVARAALRDLIDAQPVSCVVEGRDRYGRSLARCSAGRQDLGGAMVSQGYAVSYGAYEREENRARRGERGIWATDFQRPSEWRRQNSGRRREP